MSKKLIVCLSNQRCGSSLCMEILHRLGMSVGPFEFFQQSRQKPFGLYEARPFFQMDKMLFQAVYGFPEDGIPYDLAGHILKNRVLFPATVAQVPLQWLEHGAQAVHQLTESSDISGFKHPAATLFWFYWSYVFSQFPNVDVHLIFLLRPPSSIAASYARRFKRPGIEPQLYDLIQVYFERQMKIFRQWQGGKSLVRFTDDYYRPDMQWTAEQCGLRWSDTVFDEIYDATATQNLEHIVAHPVQKVYEQCLELFATALRIS